MAWKVSGNRDGDVMRARMGIPQRVPSWEEMGELLERYSPVDEDQATAELMGLVGMSPGDDFGKNAERAARIFSAAVREWALFDRKDEDGLTPMMRAAKDDLSLHDVAHNSYVSGFFLIAKDPKAGTAKLRDLITKGDYDVADQRCSELNMRKDEIVSMRIAKVGGSWRGVDGQRLVSRVSHPPRRHDPRYDNVQRRWPTPEGQDIIDNGLRDTMKSFFGSHGHMRTREAETVRVAPRR